MSLVDQIFEGGGFVNSAARFTNNTGTPILSAAPAGDGRAIGDSYALSFASVVAGTSANVTVLSSSPNNPYRATKAVVLDGVTIHKDVIPGVNLVFSASGSFGGTWAATVKVGEFLGTFDAFSGGAGVPSDGVRHRVTNDGTGAVSSSLARILPIAKWVKKTGRVFGIVRNFAEGATEKTAGGGSNRITPYVITVGTVAGAGSTKTCTLSIDGGAFAANSIRDLNTGVSQNGALIKCVAGYYYRVILGNLTGLEFYVDPAAANGDAANVLIFGARFIQIAPDVASVEGDYDVTDVQLTQDGEAAGVIQPGGYAYYWRRVLVPAGGNSESNPYPGDVALTGTETGAADWLH